MISTFEELEVWKRSCRPAVMLYTLLAECRDFSLRDQMQRAAVSIPSNIAEGKERNSIPEFKRFLRIAKGSAAELRTQLYIAKEIKIIDSREALKLINETKEISKMLQGLISSLNP
ncbi:MAG: four helix bundle protein [Desulfobacterales bacterium]|nr:four helix bundle protein [Desulfobacterales bacterium]